MENKDELNKRIETLYGLIENAEQNREEIIRITNELTIRLREGKITKNEYYDQLFEALKYRKPEDWLLGKSI